MAAVALVDNEPFGPTDYHNKGVSLSPEDHSARVLGLVKASWLDWLQKANMFSTIFFDGMVQQGRGDGILAYGSLKNIDIRVTEDHQWKDGPFKTERNREIRYTMKYNVDIKMVIVKGVEPPQVSGRPPALHLQETNW
ncbi:hypothetical protein N7494_008070 [Penicillium frequentans]|uniref:Uncharacterized protein n=1 Tax=Penicillium frequentans TaxID=3151616 RepID=A0AAD6CTQ7_9EURO|nr:hypothetical protein N7494_008070 [Penicillium glabrum]